MEWLEFFGETARRIGRLTWLHDDPEDRKYWNRLWGLGALISAALAIIGLIVRDPRLLYTVPLAASTAQALGDPKLATDIVPTLAMLLQAVIFAVAVLVLGICIVGVVAGLVGLFIKPTPQTTDRAEVFGRDNRPKSKAKRH